MFNMINKTIVPITKELLDTLHPLDKQRALNDYHEWLIEVRKDERRQSNNLNNKIYRHKPETKAKLRGYYQRPEVKARKREQSKKYRKQKNET